MPTSIDKNGARGSEAVEALLRPRSVAVVGLTQRAGSAGMNAYLNFKLNEFGGDLYLVGRSGGEIDGRRIYKEIAELPEGIDLAIFTLPAAGVHEAMRACGQRGVKAATIFASGFAEVENRESQAELVRIAREGNVAMLGPNCLGYTNLMSGMHVGFVSASKVARTPEHVSARVAIVSASGGIMTHFRQGLEQRGIPAAYTVSCGNEAGLGVPDFINYFADDPLTTLIVAYVEEVRDPTAFLAAAKHARQQGKPIIMMHPGRTEQARSAVSSHTGALAGDHAVMRTLVEHAGIALIDSLDELIDTAEVLARYPSPKRGGLGILTFSGAYCALAHDFCDEIGLALPPLNAAGEKALRKVLPDFATPRNPLDLTTQPVWQPELMKVGANALLSDPNVGSLLVSIPVGNPALPVKYLEFVLEETAKEPDKPMIFTLLGEQSPLPDTFVQLARKQNVIVSRSADRSLRALRHVTKYVAARERATRVVIHAPLSGLPPIENGVLPEWKGKRFLRAAGIPVPDGELARTVDEAINIANRIGYPVVMKAQAAALAHKTEAGGVLLNIGDEAAARKSFNILYDNVTRYRSDIQLDGILVEKMCAKGLEMVVGAKRDPRWGSVVLVGAGGTLVEAIGDVRLLPPDLSVDAIVDELFKLKTAKLLKGYRGSPAVNVEAIASTVVKVARLVQGTPTIKEIDINPLIVDAKRNCVALDALIVTGET